MNNQRRCAFIIGCLFTGLACLGQKTSFVPAFYVTTHGDTARGYAWASTKKMQTSFLFKTSPEDVETRTVPFDSCRHLHLPHETFTCWTGTRNMMYLDKQDYTIKGFDSSRTGTIPLRLLYKGAHLSLYHYRDIKDHFFMDDGASIQELQVTYRYLTQWERMQSIDGHLQKYIINATYQDQIRAAVKGPLSNKQQYLLSNLEYEERALVRLFKTLDASTP